MARALKASGPALKLEFLIGVDVDTSPQRSDIRVYKSISSAFHGSGDLAANENTSAVDNPSNKTIDTGVTMNTTTFNGNNVTTFKPLWNGSSISMVRFGADKPYFANNWTSGGRSIFFACLKSLGGGNWGAVCDAGSRRLNITKSGSSPRTFTFLSGSDDNGTTTETAADGADIFIAISSLNGTGLSDFLYLGTAGGSLVKKTGTGSGTSCGGSMSTFGGYDGDGSRLDTEVVLAGWLKDDYGVDAPGIAARDADMAAIFADPYGTFFTGGGGGGGIADVMYGGAARGLASGLCRGQA